MTAPLSLATVTAATFKPLIGVSFAVTLPTTRVAQGVLSNVTERPSHSGARRAPFSVYFEIPAKPDEPPAQGTLSIEHELLGCMELFAVPVGAKDDTVTWEIVFS